MLVAGRLAIGLRFPQVRNDGASLLRGLREGYAFRVLILDANEGCRAFKTLTELTHALRECIHVVCAISPHGTRFIFLVTR